MPEMTRSDSASEDTLDPVLQRAREDLATLDPKKSLPELLQAYQKFTQAEESQLRNLHEGGASGRELVRSRAQMVDVLMQHALDHAIISRELWSRAGQEAFTLVAVGGYGRGMLNPYSDVDVIFLCRETAPEEVDAQEALEEVVRDLSYLLFDVGYKLGGAVRTISQCLTMAAEDKQVLTSLIEARHIAGSRNLYDELGERFRRECLENQALDYIQWRLEEQKIRHEKFGATVYMQEPNVKNGCGGLRDFHNVIWIGMVKHGVSRIAGLVELGLLSDGEREQLVAAYDFILRVRTELHYLSERGNDVLTLYLQGKIAENFAYPQPTMLRKIEEFMRDYYRHARNIFTYTRLLTDRMLLMHRGHEPEQTQKFLDDKSGEGQDEAYFDGFYSRGDLLYAESPEIFDRDIFRLIRVFQHAQQRGLELSPRLFQRLTLLNREKIDNTFRYAVASRQIFEAILSRRGEAGRILRMMHEVEFLGNYVPEFGDITCLVQHEFFHRYTADEHTLTAIDELDRITSTEEGSPSIYRRLFRSLEDPAILYLALLLHDTGRAANTQSHSDISTYNALRVSRRLQLAPSRRRYLLFLVDNHGLMAVTAQRRNLSEPSTIAEFAQLVQNQRQLDALLIFTMVDSRATGENSWNDWKESLCLELYRAASSYLMDEEAYLQRAAQDRETFLQELSEELPIDYQAELRAHLEAMPLSYIRTYSREDMIRHLQAMRQFFVHNFYSEVSLQPTLAWREYEDLGFSEALLVSWDRARLLARVVGSFATAHLNILSADIYSRPDHIVLDVFRVCTTNFEAVTDSRDRAAVEQALNEALAVDDFDFEPFFSRSDLRLHRGFREVIQIPVRLSISNEISEGHTVIEVDAPDRIGLLYDIIVTLYEFGLRVDSAKINTERRTAIDTFFVMDREGRQVDESLFEPLQARLVEAAQKRRGA